MAEVAPKRRTLAERVDALLAWFVREAENPAELRRRKIVVGFTLSILSWSPAYAWFYSKYFPKPYSEIALGCLASGMALVAAVPFLIRFGGHVRTCVALLGVSLGGLLGLVCELTGGYRSPLLPWMVAHPLLALGFGGVRLSFIWTALIFAELAVLYFAEPLGIPTLNLLTPEASGRLWGATLVTLTLTILMVGWVYESIKDQTIRELQRASDAKSDFLAHMSHEIRTPMTAILGFAEELEHRGVAPEQADDLRTIRRNGEHLLVVINDILDLSRVEAGHLDLELGRTWPDRVLREVAALMEPRARESGLELRVEIDPASAQPIRSDATRLRQILTNLAANALKFTHSGHVRLAVHAPSGGAICFEVEDSGIGIPREELANIFEAFTQADASMSRRYGGTGLGLAISRQLALLFGGDLTVESEVGRGSRFQLRIPWQLDVGGKSRTPERDTPLPALADLSGRILLAEDSPDSRRLIVRLLQRWGAQVDVVENGAAAVERVTKAMERGEPHDLVLMDMQMPELDGYQATRQLRAAGFQGSIVALTAHAMAGSRDICLAAGCNDFLTKPVDRARLRETVTHWLTRERDAR
ncbi:MAG TPA: ATP-binding protein [Myxococcota bacterium]|nr:ATP-binding protein [Myxococcota bacterium]